LFSYIRQDKIFAVSVVFLKTMGITGRVIKRVIRLIEKIVRLNILRSTLFPSMMKSYIET